jgi:hypothetical protein
LPRVAPLASLGPPYSAFQGRIHKPLEPVPEASGSSRDTGCVRSAILNNVKYGSSIYSDDAVAYDALKEKFVHEVVNHAEEYVRGQVHTNGLENFWSLLKRNLRGTYVAVEPFHLERYVDEQVFRYNNRATKDNPLKDSDRFLLALSQVSGKRLTFAELTGKSEEIPF